MVLERKCYPNIGLSIAGSDAEWETEKGDERDLNHNRKCGNDFFARRLACTRACTGASKDVCSEKCEYSVSLKGWIVGY